jgi:hypothetical protein
MICGGDGSVSWVLQEMGPEPSGSIPVGNQRGGGADVRGVCTSARDRK